jgi:hypothetical protein
MSGSLDRAHDTRMRFVRGGSTAIIANPTEVVR